MDPISYGVAAKQKQRIEKVIAEPDSTSGVITVPQVIAAGETITIPAGRMAVLPNLQVDGELVVDGKVFVPSGGTFTKESINIGAVTTDELTVLGTGAAKLPSGTSAQRPANLLEGGYIRYNTELMSIEAYVNGVWGSVGGLGVIEKTTTPVLGLIWNQTDDMYKRIGKNINTLTIDGFNEFSAWRSVTAERQNDNDTVSSSPLTTWLDTSTNLPFSSMKRYVIDNTGAEVKAYNAYSFTHADQTSITATQQIMVKIPQFHYIQAKIVDGGKTYHLYAVAKSAFTLDALGDLGFIAPVITVWNPTTGVSSGTVAGNVLSSALHPAFTTNSGSVLSARYYGAFNAVSGRSICGSGVKPTASIALATARTQCSGFGTGFTQLDFFLESAKNILALIERGSNYFERGGTSLGNKWEGNSATYVAQSSYDQDNGLTLPLLNKTGVILNASNKTIANSYRGIENYHSALWRWVDGVSLSSNVVYLAKPKATFSDGTITTPYFSSGYTVPSGASASYIADFGAGSFIPVTLGGSASTKVTDAAWTGSTALLVGGTLNYASSSGLQTWSSYTPASYVHWTFVSRSGF